MECSGTVPGENLKCTGTSFKGTVNSVAMGFSAISGSKSLLTSGPGETQVIAGVETSYGVSGCLLGSPVESGCGGPRW